MNVDAKKASDADAYSIAQNIGGGAKKVEAEMTFGGAGEIKVTVFPGARSAGGGDGAVIIFRRYVSPCRACTGRFSQEAQEQAGGGQ